MLLHCNWLCLRLTNKVQSKNYLLFPAQALLDSSQGLQDLHKAADARLTQNLTTPCQTESSGLLMLEQEVSALARAPEEPGVIALNSSEGAALPQPELGAGRWAGARRTIQLH